MYADRPMHARGFHPVSLGASGLVSGAFLLALALMGPTLIPHHDIPTEIDLIPLEPPPPPIPEPSPHTRPTVRVAPRTDVVVPKQLVETTTAGPSFELHPLPPIDPGPIAGLGDEPGPIVIPTPTPPPPLIAASVDPRYADDLQPPYPPAERRAGHEGHAVVRVRIGVDGRVSKVEKVSATSDAFFAATERQALDKWRFRPATRGGVPVESWRTMGVKFVLEDR